MTIVKQYEFTSESVSEGHPDKICDRVSDAVLDYYLTRDRNSRVACECYATSNKLIIGGEARTIANIQKQDIVNVALDNIKDLGYINNNNFNAATLDIEFLLHDQSPEIASGVEANDKKELGAGDQGIMFGYAVDETPCLMPAPIYYSHKIMQHLSSIRKSNGNPGFGPDMKTQVTMKYNTNYPNHPRPIGVDNIVVSAQHESSFKLKDVREWVKNELLNNFTDIEGVDPSVWNGFTEDDILVNPAGDFIIGGPDGDAGLTGRKIIVDTYGGAAPHGGGAFSGKDPTKVDRSAAYAARWVAKSIVSAGLASKILIQLSYAIGKAEPCSIYVDSFGTGKLRDDDLVKIIKSNFDLTPQGIIDELDLLRPIYKITSSYGHFGRDHNALGQFTWEKPKELTSF